MPALLQPDSFEPYLAETAEPYLRHAGRLFAGALAEPELPHVAAGLPALTEQLLWYLAGRSEELALGYPRHAWAVTAVAEAAASLGPADRWLAGQAAWHAARAANHWVRPRLVAASCRRATAALRSLDDPGWSAACTWQLYALPWTHPDYTIAVRALEEALPNLERPGFDWLSPLARLSLAHAYLLCGRFDQALAAVDQSFDSFAAAADRPNVARTHLARSSILRRQGRFDEALAHLDLASHTFAEAGLDLDLARARFQLGYCVWQRDNDFGAAVAHYQAAAAGFQERDLPLWHAQCLGGLAHLYRYQGRVAEAAAAQKQVGRIYDGYDVLGLRADSLTDDASLEMLRGNMPASLELLRQVEQLYRGAGAAVMAALAAAYQGEVSLRLGRYQQALAHLERSYEALSGGLSPARLVECELRLARAWLELNKPETALPYLQSAIDHSLETSQPSFLAEASYLAAEAHLRLGRHDEALDAFRQSLRLAEDQGLVTAVAYAQRLLGDALSHLGQPAAALPLLRASLATYEELGLTLELAHSCLALGRCCLLLGDAREARHLWLAALAHNQAIAPDVQWQTHHELGQLAEHEGNLGPALHHYQQAMQALAQLRRGFWQPALVGSFLRRPSILFDHAVSLAARLGATPEQLRSIEESKAQTTLLQLLSSPNFSSPPHNVGTPDAELQALEEELRALYQQLAAQAGPSAVALRSPAAALLTQRLAARKQAHDALIARRQRATIAEQPPAAGLAFDLDRFRELAGRSVGGPWLALDYYVAGGTAYLSIVSADDLVNRRLDLKGRARVQLALAASGASLVPDRPDSHLSDLAAILLPDDVRRRLSPELTLIIAPHRQLHRLPWPLLALGDPTPHLVDCCIPVVVPSLQGLSLLWSRQSRPFRRRGLLTAISDFAGRYEALPHVAAEARLLAALLGDDGHLLRDSQATLPELRRLASGTGLASYDFWHVASHALNDDHSGRLSGLVLYDRDLWLDQLWELAPLPPLVTISGCSGAHSFRYEGDEHVGLPITCLAAGSTQVVASLWPVADQDSAAFMERFYFHFLAGRRPAAALAAAQRELAASLSPAHWGSFLCLGAP